MRNQFRDQRLAPRPVVGRIGERVVAERPVGIQDDEDPVEPLGVLAVAAAVGCHVVVGAAPAGDVVDDGIPCGRVVEVGRGQDHRGFHPDRPAVELAEQPALEVHFPVELRLLEPGRLDTIGNREVNRRPARRVDRDDEGLAVAVARSIRERPRRAVGVQHGLHDVPARWQLGGTIQEERGPVVDDDRRIGLPARHPDRVERLQVEDVLRPGALPGLGHQVGVQQQDQAAGERDLAEGLRERHLELDRRRPGRDGDAGYNRREQQRYPTSPAPHLHTFFRPAALATVMAVTSGYLLLPP